MSDDYKSALVPALHADLVMAREVCKFLFIMKGYVIPEDAHSSAMDIVEIINDVDELLARYLPMDRTAVGASRLPHRSDEILPINEVLDALQVTMDIMGMEVEALLRDRPGLLEEDYVTIRRRRNYVIRMMGNKARYYKHSIQARDPGAWTLAVEASFKKYLEISPNLPDEIP